METGKYFLQAILSMNSWFFFFISSRTCKALNDAGSHRLLNTEKPTLRAWCLYATSHPVPKMCIFPWDLNSCYVFVGLLRGWEHEDWCLIPLYSTPATHDLSFFPGNTVDITVNKFTTSPCKQQFLTKSKIAVLVALHGEDHLHQTSFLLLSGLHSMTMECFTALWLGTFLIGPCGAAKKSHIHHFRNEIRLCLKVILSRKDLSCPGVSVLYMSHVQKSLSYTQSFAGFFGLLYYFFQSLAFLFFSELTGYFFF